MSEKKQVTFYKFQIGNFYVEIPNSAPDYVLETALLVLDFVKKIIETQLEAQNVE